MAVRFGRAALAACLALAVPTCVDAGERKPIASYYSYGPLTASGKTASIGRK